MSDAQPPDALKNLVIFLICLAILGTVIALVVYYGVVLPAEQGHIQVVLNGPDSTCQSSALEDCDY